MLRKWEYSFSKTVTINRNSQQAAQSSSTGKIFSMVFNASVESDSPTEPWHLASLTKALDELFEMYKAAFQVGVLALWEPIQQAVERVVEKEIKKPAVSEEGHLHPPVHFWKRSHSMKHSTTSSMTESGETSARPQISFRPCAAQ